MTYFPIATRNFYPSWQASLINKALRACRDESYEALSLLYTPDINSAHDVVVNFMTRVKNRLDKMESWLEAISRILSRSPHYRYRYRDEAAVYAFREWTKNLRVFQCQKLLEQVQHCSYCSNPECTKFGCLFHETNAESSLLVYRSDFDVVRDQRTGKLTDVAILVPRGTL